MHEILTDITEGRGTTIRSLSLKELGWVTAEASLCQLGGTAPNPVLSTLRYFKDEYEEHILNKRCPAKVCRALLKYRVLSDVCKMCGACVKACPSEAITGKKKTKKGRRLPSRSIPRNVSSAGCVSRAVNLRQSKLSKNHFRFTIFDLRFKTGVRHSKIEISDLRGVSMISFVIDGQAVEGKEGSNVLQVALDAGIEIPISAIMSR